MGIIVKQKSGPYLNSWGTCTLLLRKKEMGKEDMISITMRESTEQETRNSPAART